MGNNKSVCVVDAHAHPPRKGIPGIDDRAYIAPKTPEEIFSFLQRDVEELIEEMDKVGIDIKFMMGMPPDVEPQFHFGKKNPDTSITTLTSQEWIIQAKKLHPDRFYGCACLDPTQPQSIDTLENLVKNHDFKAAKIHQAHYNFQVNDKRVYAFYRKCIKLDIPVAFHTGYSPVKNIDRLIPAMPLLLDELAYDLPELKIVMCHVGGNWYQDGVLVALRNENIMVDIAGIPWMCKYLVYPEVDPGKLIKRIVEILGPDRVMYGTDNMDSEMNPAFIESIGLGEEDARKVMGENAIRFYKLR